MPVENSRQAMRRSILIGWLPRAWRGSPTLAPFHAPIFAAIWTASLISNFGGLIQTVGASWLMTSIAPSADMVALVQASTTLPIMLLSLAAGATADIWDRRVVMLIAQGLMLAVSATLSVTAYAGLITPWLLLSLTFLLGCGAALYGPAWQSSVGEQVPRSDIAAAVALNSIAFNLARTAGPALGGLIVALAGPPAAFLTNTISYVALIFVLATWRRPRPKSFLPAESMFMAMGAGVRYARLSPGIRAVLVRGGVFGLIGSAVWALMPLIARDLIKGGAVIYGLLLGAFGCGAVIGALRITALRRRHPNELIHRCATLAFGAATLLTAMSTIHLVSFAALMVAGAAWVLTLATFNVTVQTSSPRWVVGRTVSLYQMITFGGLSLGSWIWGEITTRFELRTSLLASGALMCLSILLGRRFRLLQPEGLNLDPSRTWSQEQNAQLQQLSESGPVVVTVEYRIATENAEGFLHAMHELRRVRRRDGARRWSLMQDMADEQRWVERYHSPNWVEHLRRHHRFTVSDQEIERRAVAYHEGPEPPRVHHLIERQPSESRPEPAAQTDANLPSGPA